MSFNVKSEILSAIAKSDDANMKAVLLLLLGVFEDIGGKLDTMMRDETAMRAAVLNGHAPVHHDHHQWIERKIKEEDEADKRAAQEDQKATDERRRVRYNLAEKVVWAILAGAVGWWLK